MSGLTAIFFVSRKTSNPKSFPAFRPTPSAPTASVGEILSTTGTQCAPAATIGGFSVYAGPRKPATTFVWWNSSATEHERRAAKAYTGCCEEGINWALIRVAQASVASLSVVPLQDVLGLGSEARLNTPSRY